MARDRQWRRHQEKDPYFRRAKAEGYRARSAYKLLQIQDRFRIIRRGNVVVDLGAAPGSWSQVARELVGPEGRVIAVDLAPMEPLEGVIALQGDITDPATWTQLEEAAGGAVDVVLCDAAPSTTGIQVRDHALSIGLAEAALALAMRLLRPGGHFVVKIFEGGDFPNFLTQVRKAFRSAKVYHPPASRKESKELYVIAQERA